MNAVDYFISIKLVSLVGRWPLVDSIAVFFAQYAGYGLLIFLAFLFLWRRVSGAAFLQALFAAFISRGILTEAIRFFWHRARPFDALSFSPLVQKLTEVHSSFPSGHAAFYFAISTVVFLHSKKLGTLFLAVSFLMGIARIYGGVHWASDIVGGAALGISTGLFTLWLFSRSRRHL